MADIEHKRGQLLSNFPKKHTNQQINEKSFINSTVLVRIKSTQWLWTYNNVRPNMVLGGFPPRMMLLQAT